MSDKTIQVSGPYTHENLAVYFLQTSETADTSRYVTLEEALDQQKVVVHETGHVGELLVENLLADKDLFIQAGEIVRGGRQDRTLGVDWVVPSRSGKVPVPAFCVESGRWHRRSASESAQHFSSSKHYITSRKMKIATKISASQHEVWNSVAEVQENLTHATGQSARAADSPSSLELTLDLKEVRARQEAYMARLSPALQEHPGAVGFAFAVNGRLNSAEMYASPELFRKLWNKLLASAVVEAMAEQQSKKPAGSPTSDFVRKFAEATGQGQSSEREITGRIRVHTKMSKDTVLFETEDRELGPVRLHRHCMSLCE
jgi:hypothetical protein